MSRADDIFKNMCRDIIDNGFWDTGLDVRPRWLDGTPAHSVKKSAVNRYDLSKISTLTLRPTRFKELLMKCCGYGRRSPII